MEFDVTASTGYNTSTYTPYIQLMNSDFNSNGQYLKITSNPLITSSTNKYKISLGHNVIKFNLKKADKNVWARISTGDNSGENYLKISNLVAKYKSVS